MPPTARGAEGAGLFPPWEAATEAAGTSAAAASRRAALVLLLGEAPLRELTSMPWLPLPTPKISSRIGLRTALIPSSRAVARALLMELF